MLNMECSMSAMISWIVSMVSFECSSRRLISPKSNSPMPGANSLRPQVLMCPLLQLYLSVVVVGGSS